MCGEFDEYPTSVESGSKFSLKWLFSRARDAFDGLLSPSVELSDQQKKDWEEQLQAYLASDADKLRALYAKKGIHSLTDLGRAYIQGIRTERRKTAQDTQRQRKEEIACAKFLQEKFPSRLFSIFNKGGAGGVIFFDARYPSVLFKVSRKTTSQDDFRRQADVMKLLNETGLTPHLFEFVDEERSILVMERLDCMVGNFDDTQRELITLPENFRKSEAERIIRILEQYQLYPGDVEFVFDRADQKVRLLDPGALIPPEGKSIRESVLFCLGLEK